MSTTMQVDHLAEKIKTPTKATFYIASYGYILLVLGVTHYIDFYNSL